MNSVGFPDFFQNSSGVPVTTTELVRAGLIEAHSHGWTYDAIADVTSVPKQTVYDFATGRSAGINSTSLDKLQAWLGSRPTQYKVPRGAPVKKRGRPPKSAVSHTQVSK